MKIPNNSFLAVNLQPSLKFIGDDLEFGGEDGRKLSKLLDIRLDSFHDKLKNKFHLLMMSKLDNVFSRLNALEKNIVG